MARAIATRLPLAGPDGPRPEFRRLRADHVQEWRQPLLGRRRVRPSESFEGGRSSWPRYNDAPLQLGPDAFEQDYGIWSPFSRAGRRVYLVVPPPPRATALRHERDGRHIFPHLIPRIANETRRASSRLRRAGRFFIKCPGVFCDYQSCDACHPNDAGYDRLAGAVFRSLFYRPDLPLLAGEVINPPLNAPEVIAEWKPPASFYLAMAPAIALAVVVANLCLGVFWTCYHTARACGGPQRGRPYNSAPASDIGSDIELA